MNKRGRQAPCGVVYEINGCDVVDSFH